MRHFGSVRIGLMISAMAVLPAAAQDAAKSTLPDTAACPKAVADIATCYSAKLDTGAYLLAAMPKNWNGNLIVFAHGGPAVVPPTATSSQGDLAKYAVGVKLGFAWVASSYRKEGYGVQMAAADTDDARKFFIAHIAKPQRTILHGASYGGLVGAKLLETYAKSADDGANYDGAFFNSGAVGGAFANYEFRADLHAVYQYYCKNLPRPEETQYPLWTGIPADSRMTLREMGTLIDECTGVAKPASERTGLQKQNLANILGVMRIPERMLVRHMQAATFVFRDIDQRITHGHSAFSNATVKYHGSSDDAALNKGVARFDAEPAAAAALQADGQPTGALTVPVVSIHSMNDPQAAVEAQYEYRGKVIAAGNGARLVQAYTDENEHTGQSEPEIAASMNALMQWIEKDAKPTPQSIADACAALRATYDGPCRYHPDYQPKPLSTRFARAAAAD
jgi:hypothetical protein